MFPFPSRERFRSTSKRAAGGARCGWAWPRPAHAFTLIEVLVVVAIIALLAAVLLPSLRKARQQARTVQCATNLKTTGMGMHFYNQANRDYYPSSLLWAESIRPYVQKSAARKTSPDVHGGAWEYFETEFLTCPSDPIKAETGQLRQEINGVVVDMNHLISFAINNHLVWPLNDIAAARNEQDYAHIPISQMHVGEEDRFGNTIWTAMQRASQVKRPGDIVMLADAGDDEIDHSRAYWDFDDERDIPPTPVLEVHHGGRGGNNFLFVDLHVGYYKVLGEGSPRRGVPSVPGHWIPVEDLVGDPNPAPPPY